MKTECFECGKGILVPKTIDLAGSRNGEEFTVRVTGLECTKCGFKTVDNNQTGEFTKALSDAYRRAHGLLTGAEIRSRRRQLKMTCKRFSEYLGTGVASVKRWEAGQIQEKAMDELIRLKTDPGAARINLRALELQIPEQYVLSSVVIGDEDVELSFLLGQQPYSPGPAIKMGRLETPGIPEGIEPAVAA